MQALEILNGISLPLTTSQLEKNDFFTLYPPDGGGGFVMQQELGSLVDMKIAKAITEDNIMKDFGMIPEIQYTKFEYWKTIERSCWINRLYFIVPLARSAYLTNDVKLARLVIDTILYFNRTQKAPESKAAAQELHKEVITRRDIEYNQGLVHNPASVPYQWFDFQPASRTIHTIYALWFLKAFDIFTAEDIQELQSFVKVNAQVIADQEEILENAPGNHQALRGLALLFAGAMFKDARFLNIGAKIIEGHAVLDFHEDGLLAENSPTYHCFETWIIRDSCYLAKANGFALGKIVFDVLDKAKKAMQAVSRPDGRLVLINDGCNLNVKPLLDTLCVDANASEGTNVLASSGIASIRTGKWFSLLDASHGTGRFSHYHEGKNGITLWYKNRPFLVDSGCCNYDTPEYTKYFKHAVAHNTLLINGESDGSFRGICEWLICADAKLLPLDENGTIVGTVNSEKWKGATWQRSIATRGDIFSIEDQVSTDKQSKFTFIFNLHPDVTIKSVEENSFILENNGVELQASIRIFDTPDKANDIAAMNVLQPMATTIDEQKGMFCDNMDIIPSRQLHVTVDGTNIIAYFQFLG